MINRDRYSEGTLISGDDTGYLSMEESYALTVELRRSLAGHKLALWVGYEQLAYTISQAGLVARTAWALTKLYTRLRVRHR